VQFPSIYYFYGRKVFDAVLSLFGLGVVGEANEAVSSFSMAVNVKKIYEQGNP
jgi:hypothetical protein